MGKSIIKFSVLIIVIIAAIYFSCKIDISEPAMEFPEVLDKNGCLGLTYHRIRKDRVLYKILGFVTNSDEIMRYNVYADQFEKQMKVLKEKGATFVAPDEIKGFQKTGKFPNKCIWISFDDIDQTVYNNAFPIMKEYEIPFTIFVIAGKVGSEFSNLQLATWDQLRKMLDSGLVTVGSHTYDMHKLQGDQPIFFQNNKRLDFKKDLQLSKQSIEEELSIKIRDFAYPYGNGRSDLADTIGEVGFETAAILAPRSITVNNDRYWWNRILVNQKVFDDVVVEWVK